MKKYYVVEVEEDISAECDGRFIVESAEIMCAKNEMDIIKTLKEMMGNHLVSFSIRKANFRERREYKRQQAHRATIAD